MKIFIKYKQDVYKRNLKFLDTDSMYAWNGHVFRKLNGWEELTICMEHNKPIMVLSDEAEEAGGYVKTSRVHRYVEFVINPSSIAMVFPMEEEEKEKKDFWLCDRCGAQLPDCTCPPSSDYIGSTNRDGITS